MQQFLYSGRRGISVVAQATIKLPTIKQIAWSSTYTAVKRDRGWEEGEEGRKGEERKGKERAGAQD